MQGKFEMFMMGQMNYFLGLQVKQSTEGIFICQAKYTRNMLAKFGMQNSKAVRIPMMTSFKMNPDENGKKVDPKEYRALIRSLLYLTASRPDITFAVGVCARFQANPKQSCNAPTHDSN